MRTIRCWWIGKRLWVLGCGFSVHTDNPQPRTENQLGGMMGYLLPSEYAAYGLTAENADAWGDAAAAIFCAPGTWTTIDVATLDVDAVLGEVRLPWNVLGVPYGEVEVTYTGGLAEATAAVKVACSQIVKNAQATPGLNVKSSRVDTLQMEYFSDALIDSQVRALLRPYLAERLG